mmetsp:Transcript_3226/g.12322  ORF Transcript_3226/g.12322 Transcript_3226/m.12322 type:complete len:429 (-) Transcript_3226:342-1628(-)|eukprot:CAMPEP_0117446910 /NCGR_PEP_ID=MMETSP0759-20121206/6593_1 /TAXON_ID=63605 /ORGANISM="Percolomonas cosmopolitus, Strain WS" /LENGTH=428 /DNA_ID=CAMNT_0005239209 /DNA_START=391 /DNA_END=1677 /DNA_ORIENTATION=-
MSSSKQAQFSLQNAHPQALLKKILPQKETIRTLHANIDEVFQYLAAYTLLFSTLSGVLFLRPLSATLGYWAGFVYAYAGIPIMDLLMGVDKANPSVQKAKELSKNIMFPLLLLIYMPMQLVFLLWALQHFVENYHNMSWINIIGFAASVGTTTGGCGINVAHELFHKINSPIEKFTGIAILFQTMYSHFYIEHVWGHHKHVGTEKDPASSLKGETIYEYIPRTIIFSFIDAWRIELKKLRRKKNSFFSIHNRMLCFMLIQATVLFLVHAYYGNAGLFFFAAQSFCAITMVETVNYIEHYGLQRQKDEVTGEYGPVTILHSWNAPTYFSNALLLKLQRHSDHHAHPMKRYQTLCSYEISPQLPAGYPGLMVLSFFPPIFFRIIHPLLDRYNEEIRNQNVSSVKVCGKTGEVIVIPSQPKTSTSQARRVQ